MSFELRPRICWFFDGGLALIPGPSPTTGEGGRLEIVLPYEEEGKANFKTGLKKNGKGVLNKYANLNYLPLEQSAWAEAVRESHEDN